MFLDGGYNNVATYWEFTGEDGYGKNTYAAPVTLDTRWQDFSRQVIMLQDVQHQSRAEVWVQQSLVDNSYMALGDHTGVSNPQDLDSAYLIKDIEEIPSIDGTTYIRKAYL